MMAKDSLNILVQGYIGEVRGGVLCMFHTNLINPE